MKIFLTGINGFLGSHIAIKLLELNYHLIGLVRNKGVNKLLEGLDIDFVHGDINQINTYIEKMEGCDIVIHCAGLSDFSSKDENMFDKVNYIGTKNILESSYKCNIKRFIYISTRGVLGTSDIPENSSELNDNDQLNLDAYLMSKYKAEEEVLNNYKTILKTIVYPTALVGGNDFRPTVIGKIMSNSVSGKNLVYLDGGINVVDVSDVAVAVANIISLNLYNKRYILGGHNVLLKDLFDKISATSQVRKPLLKIPYVLAYYPVYILTKVTALLNIKSNINSFKIYSLHNKLTYCSSEKAKREFNYHVTDLDKTVLNIVNSFKETGY